MSQHGPNHKQVPDIHQLIQVMHCQNHEIPVVPVSYFKDYKALIYQGLQDNLTTFRSSGSTAQNRSEVFYSRESLKQYQKKSTHDFEQILQTKFDHSLSDLEGFSFIPSNQVWNDSSLAQMIHWFSERAKIKYVNHETFAFPKQQDQNKPFWVFATGEQILQFVERNEPIPKNMYLFETGGIKSRPFLNLEDYYQLLSKKISADQILSEYGSCELSRQAYRRPNEHYAFAADVEVFIDDCTQELKKQGKGRLVVWDKKRTDYPYAIKTEDMVILKDNQFTITGRVRGTQPRGCSLKNKTAHTIEAFQRQKNSTKQINPKLISERSLALTLFLTNNKDKFSERLAKEIGSKKAAQLFSESFYSMSLPKDQAHWLEVCKKSVGSVTEYQAKWAVLAPHNHSIATLQHLLIAYCLDIHLMIKHPDSDQLPLLDFFIKSLQQLGLRSERIPNDQQIIGNIGIPVVFFGNDENAQKIQSQNTGVFWGHRQTAYESSGKMEKIGNICQEIFHLGQAGCMNPRILIVPSEVSFKILTEKLESSFQNFWGKTLDPSWNFSHETFLHQRFKPKHSTLDQRSSSRMREPTSSSWW